MHEAHYKGKAVPAYPFSTISAFCIGYLPDKMIGLEPLRDFVELCIWTGAVAGERPASAILVAAPGGGKSSLLESLECDNAPLLTNLTTRELSATLKQHPKATHVLLSDMMNIFAHRKSVTSLVLSQLGTLTGESMRTDSFTGEQTANGRMVGLITAIPTKDLKKRQVQSHLTSAGFATRFMILRYEYSVMTKMRIHDYIKSDAYTQPSNGHKPKIDSEKKRIEISPELSDRVHSLAMHIKQDEDELGTRIHHHLRALVKARARRDGRLIAENEDIEAIAAYANFFGPQGQEL